MIQICINDNYASTVSDIAIAIIVVVCGVIVDKNNPPAFTGGATIVPGNNMMVGRIEIGPVGLAVVPIREK